MSKRLVTVNYGNRRVLLETIASYWGYSERKSSGYNTYGIVYSLRSGEQVFTVGDDRESRDKAIAFLDAHFKPVNFSAWKCDVCVEPEDSSSCRNCNKYNNHDKFERKVASVETK